MHEFSAAYAHEAGDHFVFEGGVDWPNEVFPLSPPEGAGGSGHVGNDDYYGVDRSWYVGDGYAPPVFDAQGREVENIDPKSNRVENRMVDLQRDDYVTVEGIEFAGFAALAKGRPYGSCAALNINNGGSETRYESDQHITMNDLAFVDFEMRVEPADDSHCALVFGGTGRPWGGQSIIENSLFEGPAEGTYGNAINNVGYIENDVVRRMTGMIYPSGHGVVSGNVLEDCGYPKLPPVAAGESTAELHLNTLEINDAEPGGTFYVYDNVIRGSGRGCESSALHENTYYFNNVLTRIEGNPPEAEGTNSARERYWNNSIEGSYGGTGPCFMSDHGETLGEIVVQNNLCVTTSREVGARGGDHPLMANVVREDANLALAPSRLTANHYRTAGERLPFAPSTASALGRRAGRNLHAVCKGPLEPLCFDTDYARARRSLARPASRRWDVGAYQFH